MNRELHSERDSCKAPRPLRSRQQCLLELLFLCSQDDSLARLFTVVRLPSRHRCCAHGIEHCQSLSNNRALGKIKGGFLQTQTFSFPSDLAFNESSLLDWTTPCCVKGEGNSQDICPVLATIRKKKLLSQCKWKLVTRERYSQRSLGPAFSSPSCHPCVHQHPSRAVTLHWRWCHTAVTSLSSALRLPT